MFHQVLNILLLLQAIYTVVYKTGWPSHKGKLNHSYDFQEYHNIFTI